MSTSNFQSLLISGLSILLGGVLVKSIDSASALRAVAADLNTWVVDAWVVIPNGRLPHSEPWPVAWDLELKSVDTLQAPML